MTTLNNTMLEKITRWANSDQQGSMTTFKEENQKELDFLKSELKKLSGKKVEIEIKDPPSYFSSNQSQTKKGKLFYNEIDDCFWFMNPRATKKGLILDIGFCH